MVHNHQRDRTGRRVNDLPSSNTIVPSTYRSLVAICSEVEGEVHSHNVDQSPCLSKLRGERICRVQGRIDLRDSQSIALQESKRSVRREVFPATSRQVRPGRVPWVKPGAPRRSPNPLLIFGMELIRQFREAMINT